MRRKWVLRTATMSASNDGREEGGADRSAPTRSGMRAESGVNTIARVASGVYAIKSIEKDGIVELQEEEWEI